MLAGEKEALGCNLKIWTRYGAASTYFGTLGREEADAEQLKALLAAKIIKALDFAKFATHVAHARTGSAAGDLSRIRNADLRGFTRDRSSRSSIT